MAKPSNLLIDSRRRIKNQEGLKLMKKDYMQFFCLIGTLLLIEVTKLNF
jgi:hypothetical protein